MKKLTLLIVALSSGLFATACGEVPNKAVVGLSAPEITLEDKNGKTWTLSELKGKVVFVNFWATWCPPCREEMPSMQRLYSKLPRDKFEMLAILENDKPERGNEFAEQNGITFPILYDEAKLIWQHTALPVCPRHLLSISTV